MTAYLTVTCPDILGHNSALVKDQRAAVLRLKLRQRILPGTGKPLATCRNGGAKFDWLEYRFACKQWSIQAFGLD